jgi:hypothetical protein
MSFVLANLVIFASSVANVCQINVTPLAYISRNNNMYSFLFLDEYFLRNSGRTVYNSASKSDISDVSFLKSISKFPKIVRCLSNYSYIIVKLVSNLFETFDLKELYMIKTNIFIQIIVISAIEKYNPVTI